MTDAFASSTSTRSMPSCAGSWWKLCSQATLAPFPGTAGDLGLGRRADHRLGELPPRSKSDASPEAFVHRQSIRHRGKHGAAKSKAIRTMLRIDQLDPKWTLPSKMDDNPMAWMLEVKGFLMDVRHAPREFQEMAFAKGLIPYVPADRGETGEESSQG